MNVNVKKQKIDGINLNDDERLAWSMGYGRGSGTYTGD